jgi:signal transduction histidine kinase
VNAQWQTSRFPAPEFLQVTEPDLAGRLLAAQEVERRRIARELHDEVGQSLALLAMELDRLAEDPPESPAGTVECLRELSIRVKDLSSSVHDLSHQLHPSKLEQVGLVVAVLGLCKELRRSHALDVKFTHFTEPGTISNDVALCLCRVVQEALRNVVKHSTSRHAAVELRGNARAIWLEVSDDGIGFDREALAARGGLGLISMQERVRLVGGEFVVDSRPNEGTRIAAWVPRTIPDARPEAVSVSCSTDRCDTLAEEPSEVSV